MIQESLQIIAEFKDNATVALKSLLDSLKGIGTQANSSATGLNGVAQGLNNINQAGKNVTNTLNDVVKGHAGVNRELLVLAHEASQGAWSRFGSSLLVLGEQTNALGKAFQILALGGGTVGAAIAAVGSVVAVVAYQFYEANKYVKELNTAFALTNNYANLTTQKFNNISETLSGSLLTSAGKAKDVLLELAKTGKISGDSIGLVADIIVKQNLLSGESVDELVKKYAKLSEQPAKLAAEVNSSMHILTPAQQEQIRNLDATGQKAEAAHVFYKALIDYFNGPAKKAIEDQVSWIDKITQGWAYFFDRVGKAIGANSGSTLQQIKDINKQLKDQFGTDVFEDVSPAKYQPKLQALLDKRKELYRQAANEEQKATTASFNAWQSQTAQESAAYLQSKLSNGGKTLTQALKEFDDQVKKLKLVSPGSELLDNAQLQKARQKIIDSYKDPTIEQQARQAYQARLADLDGYIKEEQDYYKYREALVKAHLTAGTIDEATASKEIHDLHMADLEEQKKYTDLKVKAADDEAKRTNNKEALADRQKFAAQIKQIQQSELIEDANYEAELAKHARTVTGIFNKMNNDIDKAAATRRTQAEREYNKINMSANEAELADQQNQIADRFAALRAQVQEQLRTANASTAEIQRAMEDLDAAEKKAMSDEQGYYDKRISATQDWRNGVVKAVKDTQEAAQNAASIMQTFVTDLTKSFEDSIYTFLSTGKVSFKDLENTFAQTINRMVAKALAAKLQEALFGDIASGGSGGYIGAGLNFLSGLFGSGKASGGSVNAGTIYPVGEKGPELFVPSVGGTIIPNDKLGANNNLTVQLHVTAMDSQSVISAVDRHSRQIADIVNNANRKYNLG